MYLQGSEQNVCAKYINKIPFLSNNLCERVEPIDGCISYSSSQSISGEYETVCDLCDAKTHFKSGDICCPYGMYNDDGVCDYNLINECKISTSSLTCDQCIDYFYFDLYMSELTVPYKCCGIGTYWDPIESVCSRYIQVEGNGNHCVLFENKRIKSCLVCEEGFYISQNQAVLSTDAAGALHPYYYGHCCEEGTYYFYSATDGHTCVPITVTNCLKLNCTYNDTQLAYLDTVTCECTKCSEGFTKNGTGASAVCCDNAKEYYSNGVCTLMPEGCSKWDNANSYCVDCLSTYKKYVHTAGTNGAADKVMCCDYNASPRQWYQNLSAENACTNPGTSSTGGVSFNYTGNPECILTNFSTTHTSIDNASCIECLDGFSPSGYLSLKCCPDGKMWNGVQQACLQNDYFNNCKQVKVLSSINDAFCTVCRDGFYFNNGVCTKNGDSFRYANEVAEFAKIVLPNCLQIQDGANDATSVCTLCVEGFEVVTGAC